MGEICLSDCWGKPARRRIDRRRRADRQYYIAPGEVNYRLVVSRLDRLTSPSFTVVSERTVVSLVTIVVS